MFFLLRAGAWLVLAVAALLSHGRPAFAQAPPRSSAVPAQPPAAAPALPAKPPAAAAAPAPATGAVATPAPPSAGPSSLPTSGTLLGQLLLARGLPPKHGVVYLEGVPAASISLPKERAVLALRSFRFQPDFLVVPVGQTVNVLNQDRVMHSLFSLSAIKPFELAHQAMGETRTLTFDRPGVVDVFCNIHETLQAQIVIVPSTYFAVVGAGGSFELAAVPPGRYRLVGYSPEAGPREQVSQLVEVRPRERNTLRLQFAQPAPSGEKQK